MIGDDDVERVVVHTLGTIPTDTTHWSTRSMANACGLSRSTVSRICRAFGLQPYRCETPSCRAIRCSSRKYATSWDCTYIRPSAR